MSDQDLTEFDSRVLSALQGGFPASQSPYCDLAEEFGADEMDVLNSAEKLREIGAVARIAVVFPDLDALLATASPDDAELIRLVCVDLPWSEHPYAEVAAVLELHGIQIDEAEVIARIREWLVDGTASDVIALAE